MKNLSRELIDETQYPDRHGRLVSNINLTTGRMLEPPPSDSDTEWIDLLKSRRTERSRGRPLLPRSVRLLALPRPKGRGKGKEVAR